MNKRLTMLIAVAALLVGGLQAKAAFTAATFTSFPPVPGTTLPGWTPYNTAIQDDFYDPVTSTLTQVVTSQVFDKVISGKEEFAYLYQIQQKTTSYDSFVNLVVQGWQTEFLTTNPAEVFKPVTPPLGFQPASYGTIIPGLVVSGNVGPGLSGNVTVAYYGGSFSPGAVSDIVAVFSPNMPTSTVATVNIANVFPTSTNPITGVGGDTNAFVYTPSPNAPPPTPEPATMLLMGLGGLGALAGGLIRRRK